MEKNTGIVVKSNHLVEAGYTITLTEVRVLSLIISKLNPLVKIESHEVFEVSALDYAKEFKISVNNAYRDMEAASKNLYERSVRINNLGGKRKDYKVQRWVSSVDYLESQGRIRISFTKGILYLLCQLESQFTQYALSDIAQMKSVYSIRIYEMLVQWRLNNRFKISVDELKKRLNLVGQYEKVAQFKVRILEPAEKEINQFTHYTMSYELLKTGRKVTDILFLFDQKEKDVLEDSTEKVKNFCERNPKESKGLTYGQVLLAINDTD